MTEELQKILQQRVERVLRAYFGGSPDELELASQAVMNEFNFVGGELREIVDTSDADITCDNGRKELAEQLVQFMRGN
jgi:hypothetical protein